MILICGMIVLRFRGPNHVPPRPSERRLIRPVGDWSWEDLSWEGRRQRSPVNSVLGRLLRHHYPGMVTVKGVEQAALKWEHYRLAEHGLHGNCAEAVLADFWVSRRHSYRIYDCNISSLPLYLIV